MYYRAAAQQTGMLKLLVFFLRFETEEHVLGINKSNFTGETTFNGNHFGIEGNHDSNKRQKTCVLDVL